jgi:SAM-dependent methyltransferase
MAAEPPDPAYESLVSPWASLTGYDRFEFERRRVAWIRRLLPEARVEGILNFGCGTATVTPSLLAAFRPARLTGVDINAEHLAAARAAFGAPGVAFETLDAHVPAADADLAYCNGVFHHIPPAQRPEALDHVHRSLRPGGVFALWENNPYNPAMRIAMGLAAIDRDAVPIRPGTARRLLGEAGFTVESLTYAFFLPRFLAFLAPLEPSLRRVPLGAQYLVLARRPS